MSKADRQLDSKKFAEHFWHDTDEEFSEYLRTLPWIEYASVCQDEITIKVKRQSDMTDKLIELVCWLCLFYGLPGLVKTLHELANSAIKKLSN